jgi:hypothetical protein
MLEVYRDERNAPPQSHTPALKPKLRSWTGRIWRAAPQSFQLMLKLDASLSVSEIGNADLRGALLPFAPELTSFALYLDYTDEGKLPISWAVGAFHVERGKAAFMRFYDFLDTVPAHVLVPLLPAGLNGTCWSSPLPITISASITVSASSWLNSFSNYFPKRSRRACKPAPPMNSRGFSATR